ncbi:glycosyl transferase [Mesorhizobium sp. L-8-10]|uniref:glycosyltransferase n=1 Tax=unclassified Mesorhizobium TaxID=325217 RepID=UPI001926E6B6|nr:MULTISPECIES: glycosyltransferase [unclassified Mesorhizobium]BCH21307.1 glycosyl transferase [Mesorhizobium sp. L-8-3]BCH29152.1 glycosyl transferase [Mesorhizobium sp. L-8-10]
MLHSAQDELAIAVLIPCCNEERTIGDVVRRFREALPAATVYVYDNNSRDLSALAARAAGAVVVREPRQGKGHVVRRMFADVEADIYLMADGDGTYAPEDAPQLVNTLLTERSDMVVGTRRGVTADAGRAGHAIGNRLFNGLYKQLFGRDFSDIFSGYRAFTRRFVKSFPAVSGGFEIETEMSVHASQLKLPVSEIALDYGRRAEGSASKLSTWKDGARILWMFAMLLKETQPLRFFGAFAAMFLVAGVSLAMPVLVEYAETGLVPRLPTWVLSMALVVLSMLMAVTGLILDSVSRARAEQKRSFYLAIPRLRAGTAREGRHIERRRAA